MASPYWEAQTNSYFDAIMADDASKAKKFITPAPSNAELARKIKAIEETIARIENYLNEQVPYIDDEDSEIDLTCDEEF